MKTNKRKSRPTPLKIFLTGAAGSIGIYSVFYLKSYPVVHHFIDKNGALGMVFAGLALLIVACLSGAWALFCESVRLKPAFLSGLSFPGLLFGASLGFGDPSSNHSKVAVTADGPTFAMIGMPFLSVSSTRSDAFHAAFELVFNPAGAILAESRGQFEQTDRMAKDLNILLADQMDRSAVTETNNVSVFRVQSIKGNVEGRESQSAPWRVLHEGESLQKGSEIKTLENGYAMITTKSESLVIRPFSHMQIPDTKTGEKNSPIIEGGVLYFFNRTRPDQIQIRTRMVTAGIRG